MTDTAVAEAPEQTDEAATAEEASKPKKVAVEPHPCYCQTYQVVDPKDQKDSVFATGCAADTKGVFAQGHDAKLVSFLVDAHFDGYRIEQSTPGDNGTTRTVVHDTPADAVSHISEPLAEKANKATLNRKAKRDAVAQRQANREKLKADRAAAKAEAKAAAEAAKAEAKQAKNTGEVVAGSVTGDPIQLAEGEIRIKVGRFEYTATVDEDGNATYVDGAGESQTVERDGYRLLSV